LKRDPTLPRTLTAHDVFAFQSVADAHIAPDGRAIVATLTRRDIATDQRVPRLIRSEDRSTWTEQPGSQGVIAARFAPDGRRVVYLRRHEGRYELAISDGTPDASPLVLHTAAAPLRELAVSPDGGLIAFQQRIETALPEWLGALTPPEGASWAAPPKHTDRLLYRHDVVGEMPESVFHIFVVPADGSAPPRQITAGQWHNGLPHHVPPGLVFCADGGELLIAGTRDERWDETPGDTDIHAIRVADGAVRRLTEVPGPTAHPAPSPDGVWIAFTATRERQLSHHLRHLYVMPAAGGAPREVLPGFDRSIGEIAWDADGTSLLVTYDDAGCTHIARVRLDGTLTVLARDAGAGTIEMPYGGRAGMSVARDGTVAYVRTGFDLPSDVAVITPNGDTATLTALNADLARETGGFHGAAAFTVRGPEGREVQCWLMLPKTAGPHPLVLEIHGGPYAQYGDRFSIKYQMIAAAGYAVLFANPTGSAGYGEDFANALHTRFPGPDYDDLMAAVDAAIERPDIDADNLFITGVSGGGVLTLWAVTHTHRFRAAVSIKPVVNWESFVFTSDIGPSIGLRWMGGKRPWEAAEAYRALSPLTHAPQARTPTLLMAGEADARTPISETMQMYAALKVSGVDAHLMRFPATSHSSSAMRPSLFAAEIAATIGWFDKHRRRL
jgi:dipeptidyl aminopeptidase/acylaminoacyl peptidase